MYMIERPVISQQILLVRTESALCGYTDDTAYTACFGILSVKRIDHIRIMHIVRIHADIDSCFDAAPNVDVGTPFSTDNITGIFHFVKHIACQWVSIGNYVRA